MANNSSFPLNLTISSVIQRRTGRNWKMLTNSSNNPIISQSVPSNRPPAHNNTHSEKNNSLLISGSSANQFRARPLKHWRKQRSVNPEASNKSNSNNRNLVYNYDVPGGTTNSAIVDGLCNKGCESTKTIPNWQTAIIRKKDNEVDKFNDLNKDGLCNPSVPNKVNINGIPSSVYRPVTSIPVCDPPTKALNLVRSTSLISKSTNKLNNQRFFQSHAAYLKQKNKTYNRNLGTRGNKNTDISSLYLRESCDCSKDTCDERGCVGLYQNSYNAFNDSSGCDCNVVVKNYNNINDGIVKRKMWGSMDASSRIQERKMAAINRAAANSNKKQSNGKLPFPDQGSAIANASKYSGRVGAPQTLKSKYYSPKQCQTDINLFRKPGNFTTGCKVPCPTAADPNKKCPIYADKPYRQSNYLIKIPITPQFTIQQLASKLDKSTQQILART